MRGGDHRLYIPYRRHPRGFRSSVALPEAEREQCNSKQAWGWNTGAAGSMHAYMNTTTATAPSTYTTSWNCIFKSGVTSVQQKHALGTQVSLISSSITSVDKPLSFTNARVTWQQEARLDTICCVGEKTAEVIPVPLILLSHRPLRLLGTTTAGLRAGAPTLTNPAAATPGSRHRCQRLPLPRCLSRYTELNPLWMNVLPFAFFNIAPGVGKEERRECRCGAVVVWLSFLLASPSLTLFHRATSAGMLDATHRDRSRYPKMPHRTNNTGLPPSPVLHHNYHKASLAATHHPPPPLPYLRNLLASRPIKNISSHAVKYPLSRLPSRSHSCSQSRLCRPHAGPAHTRVLTLLTITSAPPSTVLPHFPFQSHQDFLPCPFRVSSTPLTRLAFPFDCSRTPHALIKANSRLSPHFTSPPRQFPPPPLKYISYSPCQKSLSEGRDALSSLLNHRDIPRPVHRTARRPVPHHPSGPRGLAATTQLVPGLTGAVLKSGINHAARTCRPGRTITVRNGLRHHSVGRGHTTTVHCGDHATTVRGGPRHHSAERAAPPQCRAGRATTVRGGRYHATTVRSGPRHHSAGRATPLQCGAGHTTAVRGGPRHHECHSLHTDAISQRHMLHHPPLGHPFELQEASDVSIEKPTSNDGENKDQAGPSVSAFGPWIILPAGDRHDRCGRQLLGWLRIWY
ncbi:hypothetical protein O3P69_000798 [Scylla paramamosain]|uniref:Uncharacterized protein n=1 Tax=Scylla paramamosain TaxID=85552 RepID=A0AAW0US24_SCYPA